MPSTSSGDRTGAWVLMGSLIVLAAAFVGLAWVAFRAAEYLGHARGNAPEATSLAPTPVDGGISEVPAAPLPSRSPVSEDRVELTIRNTCSMPVEMIWLDFEGNERSYGVIPSSEALVLGTYRGHVWRAVQGDRSLVRAFTVGPEQTLALCDEVP
jgi:VHL beta domain